MAGMAEKPNDCRLCGAEGGPKKMNHYITVKEGQLIKWVAVCLSCLLKHRETQ